MHSPLPTRAANGGVILILSFSLVISPCLSFSFLATSHSRHFQQQQQQRPLSVVTSTEVRQPSMVTLFAQDESSEAAAEDDDNAESSSSSQDEQEAIDVSLDPRLYKVTLSRAVGIDWGTDLSFSFVYVRDLDPTGEAAMLPGQPIQIGDQLCEMTPINRETGQRMAPISLLGAPFDFVMNSFVGLDQTVRDVDLVFFRGTKEELKDLCRDGAPSGEAETITVTVVQNKGAPEEQVKTLTAQPGVNVRQLLVDNGINVYQSLTRWTNCNGVQLCGTCIVNIAAGSRGTNQKSVDEASTLRENPDSYRLSCVLFAYDDITVETFPPVKAAQWTR